MDFFVTFRQQQGSDEPFDDIPELSSDLALFDSMNAIDFQFTHPPIAKITAVAVRVEVWLVIGFSFQPSA